MSTGLTRSSRPHVMRVGALILPSFAQYGVMSACAAAAAIAFIALLLYMRRAISSVFGSVASAQRSSMSCSVTTAGL